jgi:hypothetical protein
MPPSTALVARRQQESGFASGFMNDKTFYQVASANKITESQE